MKSFFLSLRNESFQSSNFLNRAKELKATASLNDLDILKKLTKNVKENIEQRDIVVLNENGRYDVMKSS